MQVMEWCGVSATAAFVALVVFAARTLLTARSAASQAAQAFQQTTQAIGRLERQLDETGTQTMQLLLKTDAIAADVQSKLQSFTAITNSVQEVGSSLSEVGGTVRNVSKSLARSVLEVEQAVHTHQARVQEVLEWAVTGVELWQRWQAGRKPHTERETPNQE